MNKTQCLDHYFSSYDKNVSGKYGKTTGSDIIQTCEQHYPVDTIMFPDETHLWNILRIYFYLSHSFQPQQQKLSLWNIQQHYPLPFLFRYLVKKQINNSLPPIKNKDVLDEIIRTASEQSTIPIEQIKKEIHQYLLMFHCSLQYHHPRMKKNKEPLMISCAYGRYNMGKVQAAKKQGRTIIEQQHGIITSQHMGYIKSSSSLCQDATPHELHVWGPYFKELVHTSSLFEHITITQHPHIQLRPHMPHTGKPVVLLTSQWLFSQQLLRFAEQLATILPTWQIWLKPHPLDTMIHTSNKIHICSPKENVYQLLQKTDVHLTVFSTVGLECFAYGIPSVLFDINKYHTPRVSEGFAIINSVEQAAEIIPILYEKHQQQEAYRIGQYCFNGGKNK